ncbi:hypothetical protein GUJ93_ZPchr0001g31284 [Zizania palustris]|uniref:Fungal lipase-like domain-containing protein n=1 Tax=Zizania palustris TaxID=103762 RepID=A0A8J5RVQ2_ZIZPA|nr:hypothetical protein GUJ93_ZPchr0001g31284 [Zizania palustris]
MWVATIVQCTAGSDVLRWRSFYASHDIAWRAHYREVFDHGIREVLCCLGRVKYRMFLSGAIWYILAPLVFEKAKQVVIQTARSVLEEDDICVVAKLLGDLMAYRASGTGHLELIAGFSLLQKSKLSPVFSQGQPEAPQDLIKEAILFHPFAEAAYTGLLLDFGRNPFMFPCVWLNRQSVLTPWTRARRPILEGDNWWRGHAAAFLKYVSVPPEVLIKGRVSQTRREAAYFVVECSLTKDDLDGLINSDQLSPQVKDAVLSSFPHHGHAGIVESARELYAKLEGQPIHQDKPETVPAGFLSSLLGDGCECNGYNIEIVGHSLGGAVAALLGIRLYGRFPKLHVYAYGAAPCVDYMIADACSQFVTSIVHSDEFSARLSMNSIIRLRAAAIRAVSKDTSPNSAKVGKLVGGIVRTKAYNGNVVDHCEFNGAIQTVNEAKLSNNQIHGNNLMNTIRGGVFLFGQAISCLVNTPKYQVSSTAAINYELSISRTSVAGDGGKYMAASCSVLDVPHSGEASDAYGNGNFPEDDLNKCSREYRLPHSNDDVELSFTPNDLRTLSLSEGQSSEVYLPGLIIHIVPIKNGTSPFQKTSVTCCRSHKNKRYKALVANRQDFMDLVVTPHMFLDHLPWRCHYAMQRVIETQKQNMLIHDSSARDDTV